MSQCKALPFDGKIKNIIVVKPYVYEVINGKRKRVPPMVVENGVVVKIHKRAIITNRKFE